jgi:hypothetical protein
MKTAKATRRPTWRSTEWEFQRAPRAVSAGAARSGSVRGVPVGQGHLRGHYGLAFGHPGQSAPLLDLAGYRATPPPTLSAGTTSESAWGWHPFRVAYRYLPGGGSVREDHGAVKVW